MKREPKPRKSRLLCHQCMVTSWTSILFVVDHKLYCYPCLRAAHNLSAAGVKDAIQRLTEGNGWAYA